MAWSRALLDVLLDELHTDELCTRLVGSSRHLPVHRYPQAIALAIACLFAAQPLRAEQVHRGGGQHSERGAPHQAVRHDDQRRGGYGYSNGYGNQSYGYGYNAPPVVYAPGAAPGISLFLPL